MVKIGRQTGPLGWDGEQLKFGVDAPPVGGVANAKLIETMSQWLGVSKSMIQISKGHSTRYKTLEIDISQTKFDLLLDKVPKIPHQRKLF